MASTTHAILQPPTITEDDLLAFQYQHFGDDSKPDDWFVDAETALNVAAHHEEDELGYYEDGTKRTLTDEQIAMFRHSEIEELLRERRLQREEAECQERESEEEGEVGEDYEAAAPRYPDSDSGLEDDLIGLARPSPAPPAPKPKPKPKQKAKQHPQPTRDQSQSSRSDSSRSTGKVRKRRRKEVPYYERNKRKWEDYIDENDPVHGSMTHRRLVREQDAQRDEEVDIDYGEEAPSSTRPGAGQEPAGRRMVPYED